MIFYFIFAYNSKNKTMKTKLLLTCIFTFIAYLGQAQIDDGSVAPDFTVEDIFGNTHHLQSYLDDGKTVILNISATWCGPCWNFMQSGSFKDVYKSHGPEGSDDIMILYVEGSAPPAQAIDLLYGIGSNTLGNWVDGTPYPIIASQSIASSYEITYFPTVYRICPDGFVFEMGQLNREGVIQNINDNCSGVQINDAENHVFASVEQVTVCEDGDTTEVTVNITNLGNQVSSVEFELDVNGEVSVFTNDLNLNKWQSTSVSAEIEANANDVIVANVTNVNNNTPNSTTYAETEPTEVSVSSPTGRDIEVRVYTDNYPNEISWQILDEADDVIFTGGPYKAGKDDNFGGGGFFAQTTIFHNVKLPAGEQCFSVRLLDSYGDGWSLSAANWDPGIEIFYEGESIYKELVGNFGFEVEFDKALKHLVTMNTNDFELEQLEIYPNPSDGNFNISSAENFNVSVYNLQGKKVFEQKNMNQISQIQLNQSSGVYIAEFTNGSKKTTKKLIIK